MTGCSISTLDRLNTFFWLCVLFCCLQKCPRSDQNQPPNTICTATKKATKSMNVMCQNEFSLAHIIRSTRQTGQPTSSPVHLQTVPVTSSVRGWWCTWIIIGFTVCTPAAETQELSPRACWWASADRFTPRGIIWLCLVSGESSPSTFELLMTWSSLNLGSGMI